MTRRGFTLVELMVSVAIVTLLIAIAVPLTSRVMGYASTTRCVNNLRQLGAAVTTYTDHHDNFYPCASCMPSTEPAGGLPRVRDLLEPHTSAGVFRCTADRPVEPDYAFRSYFEGEGSSYEWAESANGVQAGQKPPYAPFRLDIVPILRDYGPFHRRGGNVGINGLFVDGHVETF